MKNIGRSKCSHFLSSILIRRFGVLSFWAVIRFSVKRQTRKACGQFVMSHKYDGNFRNLQNFNFSILDQATLTRAQIFCLRMKLS